MNVLVKEFEGIDLWVDFHVSSDGDVEIYDITTPSRDSVCELFHNIVVKPRFEGERPRFIKDLLLERVFQQIKKEFPGEFIVQKLGEYLS